MNSPATVETVSTAADKAKLAVAGLLVVGPWLGHASWHAYRSAVKA